MPFTNQKSIRNSINVIKFFLNRKYTSEILNKVYSKFFDPKPKLTNKENLDQIVKSKISSEEFIQKINPELLETVNEDTDNIILDAKKIQEKNSNIELGNNYAVEIIYFLMINFKPNIILETGVAAGLSSRCILEAIKKNSKGVLYSSDFPYFRLENPEKYIGYLAKDESNKDNWFLDIRGDDIALHAIVKKMGNENIDLFHYDSDKSYSGRSNALKSIGSKLSSKTIIIFDDIQNNLHFKDLVEENKEDFHIIGYDGKFTGIIGLNYFISK